MKTEKLTKEELDRLQANDAKYLKRLESQKQASARRRAKLKEQGKTQVTLMVSIERAEQIKTMIKMIEEQNMKEFALVHRTVMEGKNDGKPDWYIKYKTK